MKKLYIVISYFKSSLILQILLDRILVFLLFNTKIKITHEYSYYALASIFKNKKKMSIIDVGANIGTSSLYFLRLKKNCTIHAFEPNRSLLPNLQKIRKKFLNFKYYNYALGDKNTKKTFFIPKYKNLYNHYLSSFKKKSLKKKLIEDFSYSKSKNFTFYKKSIFIKKLDNFNLKPDFIKIDTEGYEFEVIKGALKTIQLKLPILLIECNDFKVSKKIFDLLGKFNYKFYLYNSKKFQKYNIYIKQHNIGKLQKNFYCIPKKMLNT